MTRNLPLYCVFAIATYLGFAPCVSTASDWTIPLAGNSFGDEQSGSDELFDAEGSLLLTQSGKKYSVYFRLDRPGTVELAFEGYATSTPARIEARVNGAKLNATFQGTAERIYPLGKVNVQKAGYVRVDIIGRMAQATATANIKHLLVSSDVTDMTLDFVSNDEGNMFYWGRRGPSVHLSYQLPDNTALTHAYSEITVPVGQDPIGSYYMANGFSEGYFGIQVNSISERRVLFSVWSPYATDDPSEIPDEQRIVTVAKGAKVKAQDFGNEGAGGQSYLVYPWKAGVTYRFLTEVKPDGDGNTLYTSWFGDKRSNEWRLLASFLRPKTDKYLTGFHSFLESFEPKTGNIERSARYSNQWVRDTDDTWHEITQAKLTGDTTARTRQRLDFAGGSEGSEFFLRNCGFFDQPVTLDQLFQRKATNFDPTEIIFEGLPRK